MTNELVVSWRAILIGASVGALVMVSLSFMVPSPPSAEVQVATALKVERARIADSLNNFDQQAWVANSALKFEQTTLAALESAALVPGGRTYSWDAEVSELATDPAETERPVTMRRGVSNALEGNRMVRMGDLETSRTVAAGVPSSGTEDRARKGEVAPVWNLIRATALPAFEQASTEAAQEIRAFMLYEVNNPLGVASSRQGVSTDANDTRRLDYSMAIYGAIVGLLLLFVYLYKNEEDQNRAKTYATQINVAMGFLVGGPVVQNMVGVAGIV